MGAAVHPPHVERDALVPLGAVEADLRGQLGALVLWIVLLLTLWRARLRSEQAQEIRVARICLEQDLVNNDRLGKLLRLMQFDRLFTS